jgi:hypothetical protein
LDSSETSSARLKNPDRHLATDFSITIHQNPQKLSAPQYFIDLFENLNQDMTTLIDSVPAYADFPVKVNVGVGGDIIIIPKSNYFIEIGYTNSLANQILSTFKFID